MRDIDSGTTSPSGQYRWMDVADQAYSSSYQGSYNYTRATVRLTFASVGTLLHGQLIAADLKPNFAYQLKLVGVPDTPSNERIGLAGRWWQEEWNGTRWSNGQNLNNKGDGTSPSPNDQIYYARRDVVDSTSPTLKHYRYTGYLVFDYFVTDSLGNASPDVRADSSYHVLWKTTQRSHTSADGPIKTNLFDVDPNLNPAYATDYPPQTVSIFGEWERLPAAGVFLAPGDYVCQMILTEESFHGSGGALAGNWAAAMGVDLQFAVVPVPPTSALAEGKLLPNSSAVQLVSKAVTYAESGLFYIENDLRTIGIMVKRNGHGLSKGMRADVTGTLETNADGEKYVWASSATHNGDGSIDPYLMPHRSLGGGVWQYSLSSGAGQAGVTGGVGLNNIGLLIRVFGKVTQIGPDYLYINDGSNLRDGTITDGVENLGVRVICDPTGYNRGDFLVVTGISSCFEPSQGVIARRILTRRGEDINRVALGP